VDYPPSRFLKVFVLLAYQPAGYRLKSNISDNTAHAVSKFFTIYTF
jgi:hypothetical protein